MSMPSEELALDRMIHEPGRLAIMTVLSSVESADFTFLQQVTGLTKGNLSSHLSKLEEAGLLHIDKRFVLKKPKTSATLSPLGRERIEAHWKQLDRLKALSKTPVAE